MDEKTPLKSKGKTTNAVCTFAFVVLIHNLKIIYVTKKIPPISDPSGQATPSDIDSLATAKMAKITKEKVTSCLKGSWLTLATLCGVIGGVVLGVCLKQARDILS